MSVKKILAGGLISLVCIGIVIVLDNVFRTNPVSEPDEELLTTWSREAQISQPEDEPSISHKQPNEPQATTDGSGGLELDSSSDSVGPDSRHEESGIDSRRQDHVSDLGKSFESLANNPNNRIEIEPAGLPGVTLIEDAESKILYYFATDPEHPAYLSDFWFTRLKSAEGIKWTYHDCNSASVDLCGLNWGEKTVQQLLKQNVQQTERSLIKQHIPGITIENWSASLAEPLDGYTKDVITQIVSEEYVATGLISESGIDAETWLTGMWDRTSIETIRESDVRALDRVESYLTEEQYRSYIEFLENRRAEDIRYLQSKEDESD